jgi:hypothetical protein
LIRSLVVTRVQFTDDGSVTLAVRVSSAAEEKLQLIFEVTDTGIGESADSAARTTSLLRLRVVANRNGMPVETVLASQAVKVSKPRRNRPW